MVLTHNGKSENIHTLQLLISLNTSLSATSSSYLIADNICLADGVSLFLYHCLSETFEMGLYTTVNGIY